MKIATFTLLLMMAWSAAGAHAAPLSAFLSENVQSFEVFVRKHARTPTASIGKPYTRPSSMGGQQDVGLQDVKLLLNEAPFSSYMPTGSGQHLQAPKAHRAFVKEAISNQHKVLQEPKVDVGPNETSVHTTSSVTLETKVSEQLRITFFDGMLKVNPKRIEWQTPNKSIQLRANLGKQKAPLRVFVRDEKIVTWSADRSQLSGQKAGDTEIFIVVGDQMSIIPVKILGKEKELNVRDSLNVAASLTSVKTIMQDPMQGQVGSFQTSLGEKDRPDKVLSLDDSEVEAELTRIHEQELEETYVRAEGENRLIDFKLQVLDDRSSVHDATKIYAVEGVNVRVIGSDYILQTDRYGGVKIANVPLGARLLIHFHDPAGRYMPSVQEVEVREGGFSRVKLLRELAFTYYSQSLGSVQDTSLASICGILSENNRSLAGKEVVVNVEADGPLYFNEAGFPDASMRQTGTNGKFCFFNVEARLAELDIYRQGSHEASFAVPFAVGAHLEEDFAIGRSSKVETYLASMPSSVEQIESTGPVARKLRSVDFAELVAVGYNEAMEFAEPGLVLTPEGREHYRGRLYALLKASEYEPVLYSYDESGAERPVTPLFPNGYVEGLFYSLSQQEGHASIAYDRDLGVVLMDYGHLNGSLENLVDLKLLDSSGRMVDTGWHYGASANSTQAVFFNLQPGIYTAQVLSESGQWLDVSTAIVEYETVTYIGLGQKYKRSQ